jgi:hypothetical protein
MSKGRISLFLKYSIENKLVIGSFVLVSERTRKKGVVHSFVIKNIY